MKKQSLTLVLAILLPSGTAMADSTYFDIIYSPPTGEMTKTIGFGVYALNDNGVGGYFNGMIPIKPSNYSAGNYCWYSCAEVATGQAAYVGNLGFTFPLIPASFEKRGYQSVHAYVGLGYSAIEGMVKYSDGTWTDDTYRDKNGFNANGGLIVAFDPISINVGVNTFTKAVYLGLGFKTK